MTKQTPQQKLEEVKEAMKMADSYFSPNSPVRENFDFLIWRVEQLQQALEDCRVSSSEEYIKAVAYKVLKEMP